MFQSSTGDYATTVDVWVRENDGETVQSIVITVLTDLPVTAFCAEQEAMAIARVQVRDEGAWGGVFAASARAAGYPITGAGVAS